MTTAKVEKLDLVSKVTANGKIQAQRKVDMSALVMGQIVNLAVKEGDHVKKGQLLLQIDRAQLAAQAQGRGVESRGDAPRPRRGQGDRGAGQVRLRARRRELQGEHPRRGRPAEGQVEPRHGAGEPRRHRAAHALHARRTSRRAATRCRRRR